MPITFRKDNQYYKFCAYGFFKNLRFFDPFLLLFFLSKGLSFFEIGTLYAIREITINLFEIPTGILADSLGRRRSMISAFSFYIVSFIIFFFASDYWVFIIAILFYAYGDAFRTGTHKAMIFEYLKINGWQDQKVHYYGHTRSWSQMGSAVSAIIAAGIVFFTHDYRMVFLFSVIPYVVDLALMTTYPKELDGKRRQLHKGEILDNFKETIHDFVTSFRNIGILRAILNQAVYTGYYKAVKDYLQPVIQGFAVSLPILLWANEEQRASIMVGLVFSVIYFLTSYASRHAGRFADRFRNLNRPLVISLSIGLMAGFLSGLFYNRGWYLGAVVCYTGIYLIENLRKPIGISIIADRLEKDILATALSAESQAETLFAAIIAPVIGLVADLWGVGTALMVVSSGLFVLMPLYSTGRSKTKQG
ncbi:MAG TPA: MFS transporter [Bacteroidales bacterium]|nr:MAG: MFS transporter [Bacteroidetes bacterium GWE2_42_24]OFY27782.1 MAG: MFS transporter [Bacteroidetes bacterium GWF2_43_11]PKP25463.1 MAG: MFS transporter [Bacteroidetes bacterium HGW-Bacteroidetes-22]HAQ64892.1 MFS transporter [Bacteroidales bacterium]HBZ66141.1 MFS transporter [Bacteroidales bacterium]